MAEIAWFIDELYIPAPLQIGGVRVVPLLVRDRALASAVTAFMELTAEPFATDDATLDVIDIAALVFEGIDAPDVATAFAQTSGAARLLAAALGVRQFGRGHLIGALARGDGWAGARRLAIRYPQVLNIPFMPESSETGLLLDTFSRHPEALVLAEMFVQGVRDRNPSAGIARIWAVLEALGEQLPGSKEGKVRRVLRELAINEPEFDGDTLLRRAYIARNDFMHHGRQLPEADGRRLLADLLELAWFVLRHAGYLPLPRPPRS